MELAVAVGASEIAVEGFAARETYQRVVKDAIRRTQTTHPIRLTTWPPKGSGRGGGDALARSAALQQGLETGTARIAGHACRILSRRRSPGRPDSTRPPASPHSSWPTTCLCTRSASNGGLRRLWTPSAVLARARSRRYRRGWPRRISG